MAYEKQFWEESYNNSGEEERLEKEVKRLKIQRWELLTALKEMILISDPSLPEVERARKAFAKAKGTV